MSLLRNNSFVLALAVVFGIAAGHGAASSYSTSNSRALMRSRRRTVPPLFGREVVHGPSTPVIPCTDCTAAGLAATTTRDVAASVVPGGKV